MCGILGVIHLTEKEISETKLELANDLLSHRGPDASGIYLNGKVGLAHRRLSIIDLSGEANQPMHSSDGRYTIVYNGEIYNFKELRKILEEEHEVKFHTNSDTEVVLSAFIAWGTACFRRFNGMFAFCIHDAQSNQVYIVRDRFGIKPLYYLNDGSQVVFASEIVAINSYLGERKQVEVSPQALTEYMWFGNPLGSNTIYKHISELLPGRYLSMQPGMSLSHQRYWSPAEVKEQALDERTAATRIYELLDRSVMQHLISDVPVGIFLSGGVDSSILTALASRHYSGKIKTYSVGFDFDKGINELPKAKKIAELFGTDHQELFIEGKNLPNIIERLVDAHGEPFGDAADIPLYLLTAKMGHEVKVVLQGDGGDELFGGYSRYFAISRRGYFGFWRLVSGLPWHLFRNTYLRQKVRFLDAITTSHEADKLALLLTMESRRQKPTKVFSPGVQKLLADYEPFLRYRELDKEFEDKELIQRLFNIDISCILPDTFLEKVDKATMANGVEVRVPFLDNDLVEFALSIPSELKIKNGVQKYLLKKAFEKMIPHEILYGPKTGFGVPYAFWIQKSLVEFMKENIHSQKVRALNIFEYGLIDNMIEHHSNGKGNYGFILWKCLVLSIWINKQQAVSI